LTRLYNGENAMRRQCGAALFLALAVTAVAGQSSSKQTIVIGFLGGFERWNDEHRGVRHVALDIRARNLPGVYAETFGNHNRRAAMRLLRRSPDARVILYGQSWGGAAVVKAARELEGWGVPVLLTIQVDSVGVDDAVIPGNVRAALNLYQHDPFTIQGRSEIRAADPSRTRILGNFRYTYPLPAEEGSWARRKLGGSHARMELDPAVWARVEELILDIISKE
jgi:pimeloyl-ACP methyl ester carboxylesterase